MKISDLLSKKNTSRFGVVQPLVEDSIISPFKDQINKMLFGLTKIQNGYDLLTPITVGNGPNERDPTRYCTTHFFLLNLEGNEVMVKYIEYFDGTKDLEIDPTWALPDGQRMMARHFMLTTPKIHVSER